MYDFARLLCSDLAAFRSFSDWSFKRSMKLNGEADKDISYEMEE